MHARARRDVWRRGHRCDGSVLPGSGSHTTDIAAKTHPVFIEIGSEGFLVHSLGGSSSTADRSQRNSHHSLLQMACAHTLLSVTQAIQQMMMKIFRQIVWMTAHLLAHVVTTCMPLMLNAIGCNTSPLTALKRTGLPTQMATRQAVTVTIMTRVLAARVPTVQ